VRRALGRALDTDEAAAARLVFHDDLLTERARQILADHARRDVRRTARRIRHDEPDRTRWISLSACYPRCDGDCDSTCSQMQEFAAGKFHVFSLNVAGCARCIMFQPLPGMV